MRQYSISVLNGVQTAAAQYCFQKPYIALTLREQLIAENRQKAAAAVNAAQMVCVQYIASSIHTT